MALKLTVILAAAIAVSGQQWSNSTYPSPAFIQPPIANGTGWEAAFTKAKQFLSQLTPGEKALIVTGVSGPCAGNIPPIKRLNFGGICLNDGPLAIRSAVYATVFPAGVSVAATFDKDYMRRRGQAIGQEFKQKGAHVALGPVAGPLGRDPRGGRNWEGFSPDPYLTGVAMEETITGMQSAGTQATAKHYVGNEQETQRNPSKSKGGKRIQAQSVNLDDRTIHELYTWPFANSVHAGVAAIMCSYNRLNSTHACENSKVLNGILKEELGFQGYVMSDWGAIHTPAEAARSGTDMAMPNGYEFYNTTNSTTSSSNSTTNARLEDMILRIMTPYYHLGQDVNFPTIDPSSATLGFSEPSAWKYDFNLTGAPRDVRSNHKTLVREGGASGSVLLKNVNRALPLAEPNHVVVFGNAAGDLTEGMYSIGFESGGATHSNYEFGTTPVGGGSGTGRFTYVVTPLEAIKTRVNTYGGIVSYALDNKALVAGKLFGDISPAPDVCIVMLKSWAAEGWDRDSLASDWDGDKVVDRVAAYCRNTIVVTNSAGINTMPWAHHPNVTGILAVHYPGQEIGNSLVDILYGDVNPSGRLPYTIAHTAADYNTDIQNSTALQQTENPDAWQTEYTEKLLIDYRYFDAANKSVLYEFGFGLSYTNFSMASMTVTRAPIAGNGTTNITAAPPPGRPIPGGVSSLWDTLYNIGVTVTNTGSTDGAAVPQLYVGLTGAPAGTPVRQLRGFTKIDLSPQQSETVALALTRRDLSYWDTDSQQWLIPSGRIELHLGFSSRDLKLHSTINI